MTKYQFEYKNIFLIKKRDYMKKTAIINLGIIVSGNWRKPFKKGDGILMNRGLIQKVATLSNLVPLTSV